MSDHKLAHDTSAFMNAPSPIGAANASEISTVRAQLAAAEAQADALRGKVDQQARVIRRIEQDLRTAELAAMQARAEALQVVKALQQARETRKMKGRLRRVWAAWRGK